jgi:hypothetical protein
MRCSMICVTVSSTVFAEAPRLQVMVIVGGAMLGP